LPIDATLPQHKYCTFGEHWNRLRRNRSTQESVGSKKVEVKSKKADRSEQNATPSCSRCEIWLEA